MGQRRADGLPWYYLFDTSGSLRLCGEGAGGRPVRVSGPAGDTELLCDGAFGAAATPDDVFNCALRPLCDRLLRAAEAEGAGSGRYCGAVAAAQPVLVPATGQGGGGVASLAIGHLLGELAGEGAPCGALRFSLCCFLNDPAHPTDLLRHVRHEHVPPEAAWGQRELEGGGGGLPRRRFVYCNSPASAARTLRLVLGAPPLQPLLPRLSFVCTLALRGRAGAPVPRLTLLDLRLPAAAALLPQLRPQPPRRQPDLVSDALCSARGADVVVVWRFNAADTQDWDRAAAALRAVRGETAGEEDSNGAAPLSPSPPPGSPPDELLALPSGSPPPPADAAAAPAPAPHCGRVAALEEQLAGCRERYQQMRRELRAAGERASRAEAAAAEAARLAAERAAAAAAAAAERDAALEEAASAKAEAAAAVLPCKMLEEEVRAAAAERDAERIEAAEAAERGECAAEAAWELSALQGRFAQGLLDGWQSCAGRLGAAGRGEPDERSSTPPPAPPRPAATVSRSSTADTAGTCRQGAASSQHAPSPAWRDRRLLFSPDRTLRDTAPAARGQQQLPPEFPRDPYPPPAAARSAPRAPEQPGAWADPAGTPPAPQHRAALGRLGAWSDPAAAACGSPAAPHHSAPALDRPGVWSDPAAAARAPAAASHWPSPRVAELELLLLQQQEEQERREALLLGQIRSLALQAGSAPPSAESSSRRGAGSASSAPPAPPGAAQWERRGAPLPPADTGAWRPLQLQPGAGGGGAPRQRELGADDARAATPFQRPDPRPLRPPADPPPTPELQGAPCGAAADSLVPAPPAAPAEEGSPGREPSPPRRRKSAGVPQAAPCVAETI